MTDNDGEERPPHRGKVASGRVPDEVYDRAQKKAKKQGRNLGDIIAAFLHLWSDDEWPDPPRLPGEGKRAKKRSRKDSQDK